jgi:ATP-binding cassette, subfamily B, bacterial
VIGGRRVPLLFQSSNAECGSACLAMVLGYHGYRTSVREVREWCPPGRDGISAGALVRTARGVGLLATAYRAGTEVLRSVALPAIAHWQDNHFVVVTGITDRHVAVVDPQIGRQRLSWAEVDASLGRVVVSLSPGPDFRARKVRETPFWRIYLSGLLRLPGTRGLLLQVLAASLLLQVLGLAVPFVSRSVVDGTASATSLLGLGVVLVVLAQLVTVLLRSALLIYLQGRLDARSMLGFCAHLLSLPLRYFEQRSTGDITMRIGSLAILREVLTSQTLSAALDTVLVLSYLGILFALDVTIGLAVLAVVVVAIAVLVGTTRRVRERMAADVAAQSRLQGHVVESLEGIATIKALAAEAHALDRWAELFFGWMQATLRRGYLAAAIDAVAVSLRALTPLLVLWIAITRVRDGSMGPGTMLAVTWLSAAIVTPLSSVLSNGQRLQLAGAQLQRLADVLRTEPQQPGDAAPRLTGRIDLDAVGYRYDPVGPPVLQDVSLSVRPGQRVAVVGRTGAGKTTLGMVLLGLYPASAGELRFDGVALSALTPVRGQIGVVLQDPFVFSGTIRQNIAFHDPDVDPERIEWAARVACLHEDIAAMPLRYDTRLAERGTGLSGGQRQRLALARALVRKPAILLLDEATSHLDAATEARVHRNLAEIACTQIVIAHRLSTIRDADQIVVLDQGRIVQCGTHDELLAEPGCYTDLVAAQLNAPHTPAMARTGNGSTERR